MKDMKFPVARFWRPLDDQRVACGLCPHECVLKPGATGICRVRRNVDGKFYAESYGLVTSLALDPVEKKPLFHVEPGGWLLSVGSFGCNLRCDFCQNWGISQTVPRSRSYAPEDVVLAALRAKDADDRVVGLAYTYNEPIVGIEFLLDCAGLAKRRGLLNVMVTNGFASEPALRELLPLVDAFNVDVKAWDDGFYRRIAFGRLEPVKRTVESALREGAWVEVTYLVIPGENDSDDQVDGVSRWLAGLSRSVPLHLSRYFPAYNSERPMTPQSTLERLRDVARSHLDYVYLGNTGAEEGATTYCPGCGEVLLERGGMDLLRSRLQDGHCPNCGREADLIGSVHLRKKHPNR